jgi:peptidoglycan/xylan/chitin deacetylase (PgdA/CDA1 family)
MTYKIFIERNGSMVRKKTVNIILIIIAVLLVVGIVVVYIVGEKRLKEGQEKKMSGARQVNSEQITNEGSKEVIEIKIDTEEVIKNNLETSKPVDNVRKNRFEGMNLKYNDKSIPVLMYHSVEKEVLPNGQLNELRVPKEIFKEQMKYLKDNGFTTLTLDEAYKFWVNNEGVPEKSVVLTFDDGYTDNYTNAYPILKEFGFNASIFVITAVVDKDPNYMTSAQLRELDVNGIEIHAHTVNHEKLSELSYEKQMATLKESKEFVEKLLNKRATYTAYPYGMYNDNTIKAATETGYTMGLTTKGKWSGKEDGLLTLDRVYISSLRDLENFKERINNPDFK